MTSFIYSFPTAILFLMNHLVRTSLRPPCCLHNASKTSSGISATTYFSDAAAANVFLVKLKNNFLSRCLVTDPPRHKTHVDGICTEPPTKKIKIFSHKELYSFQFPSSLPFWSTNGALPSSVFLS